MRRLAKAGFRSEFVRTAILPDWWDDDCSADQALLPDIEVRIARFFQVPLADVMTPGLPLAAPAYAGAQLRRINDVDRDRLSPAIHAAVQIASAAVRSLKLPGRPVNLPPDSGLAWRRLLSPNGQAVKLEHLLADLWERGIPVIPIEHMPVPSFQGLACIVNGRPVILLGQKYDEPGRVAFLVAHEAGHIANSDCSPDHPVVDADDEVQDDTDLEVRADRYGLEVLAGCTPMPVLTSTDFRGIAKEASQLERTLGVDGGVLISSWARRSRDYPTATMATKALYRSTGGRNLIRDCFDHHIDLDGANDTDRTLLQCVFQVPAFDDAAD